ncbi:MAG TPA: hypothetical protein VF464_08500 [Candidatus Methylomirabilis sp.]
MTLSARFRGMLLLLLALLLTAVGVRTYLQSSSSAPSLPVAAPTTVYIQPKTGV